MPAPRPLGSNGIYCTRCALPVAGTGWVADLTISGDEPGAVHFGCLTLDEQFEVAESVTRHIDRLSEGE